MKPNDSDPEQGEGDRKSARRYNRKLREFIAEGKVEGAAHEAETHVERERGTKVSVDELVAKGRTVFDRMRPLVSRVVARARRQFRK